MSTGFYWDERCLWFGGGDYAFTQPVGGLVQPPAAGGLPESPETKRRLVNLLRVTGLSKALAMTSAPPATTEDLLRVHPQSYLTAFKAASDAGGGELGPRAPFGAGGFEQAVLSAGLAKAAIAAVLHGTHAYTYALSRPPGHHCLPDHPNGFCLLANIAIGVEAARADRPGLRTAILDWDVHHGNGSEAIYAADANTLTISIHQERNYPLDTGSAEVKGPAGTNLNIPLPPGAGDHAFRAAMERLACPAIEAFAPELIVVACGYDAAAIDPLSRTLATADTFRHMTRQIMATAKATGAKLALVHEGGYSEVYVPFCAHAVLEELTGSAVTAEDPFAATFAARQPGPAFDAFIDHWLAELHPPT
ncbi:MAG: class II histone deacetylase [Shimia sp.]